REIAYVNGHGTGTAKNDPAESRALLRVLGPERAGLTPVSSTKATVGHLLGAAGAVEAIVTAHALAERVAPPTAGYTTPDPDCPLDYVPGDARPMAPGVAVSTNFGFGGANAALVLAPRGHRPPLPAGDDIVVTGVAVTMPSGEDVAALWAAYEQGREPGEVEDGMRQARVDIDPEPYLNRRDRRRMDRLGVLSVVTAARALTAAGLEPDSAAARPVGIVFGTGTGPSEALERFTLPVLDDGVRAADPSVFPNTVYNQAAGQIALHLGLRGPTSTLSVGHATGAAVVGHSADLLGAGHADAVVCTVTDTLTPYVARAYADAGAASTRAPGTLPDGRFLLAEGSVALVLERRSAAL
ncbi:beta-ketoacyl synthase N-terminal-like domain-containing protein, partial [Streptomyces sp. T-3]|nr:beta-ketoacyl synthase N-terminal-like domain-containing protein [Streptomyces sp. T-3]